MKYVFLVMIVFAVQACDKSHSSSTSQNMKSELWWTYLADYDGLPGSTIVNLGLKTRVPIHDHLTLVVTGVSYESPAKNSGLPDAAELDFQHSLSKKRLALITSRTPAIFVGSFTHKNERLDYIYVSGATGLEAALRDFYKTECPDRSSYINIKSDPRWEAYLDFLYPNAQTIEHYRTELHKLGAL